jgi:ABC-type nitrate/sulfonate/bicarbonate transport system permease component
MSQVEQSPSGTGAEALPHLGGVKPVSADAAGRRARYLPLISVASIIVVLVLWWMLTSGFNILKPLTFPSPEEVITAAGNLGATIVTDAFATLARVLVSWLGGSALGVLVGLVMVRSRVLYFAWTPLIEALRPVPPVALIPFVIVWFGIGDSGKIFLGGLGCFMVMVVNTVVAAGHVAPNYVRAARSLGASENQVYRTVILPAIIPQLISGLRIAAALAFGTVVAAEFIGAENGIGARIMLASRTLDTGVVLLGTIVIGLMAFLVEQAIRLTNARATRWAERTQD